LWKNPWELLVATVLAAQCTDTRVNHVTPTFFKLWPDVFELAQASQEDVEQVIRSTGFYRNKSKNLLAAATKIVNKHQGQVPSTMTELLSLPGVARKTANIILSNAFGIHEGIAVDTHVKRVSYRLGLTQATSPIQIEKDLVILFPRHAWGGINHLLVWFGRDTCRARRPLCPSCPLKDLCPQNGIKAGQSQS
jgi:endonuclease-3